MSLIQTQISLVHIDSGINLSSALQKTTRSAAFSFDGVSVTTTPSTLDLGSITNPRTITMKLVSGDDVLVSLDGGVTYTLSLHGNDDAMLLSLESREVTTITCGADANLSLNGDFLDLQDSVGTVRAWFSYPTSTAKAAILLNTGGGSYAPPANNSTMTIGTKIYTFITGVGALTEGQIRVDADAAIMAARVINAINRTGTSSTSGDYYCASANADVAAHPIASETYTASKSVMITSKVAGNPGNSMPLASSSSPVSNIAFGTFPTIVVKIASNPVDGNHVTVGSAVYTFKDTPTTAGHVAIEGLLSATCANLVRAINKTGVGNGSDYFAATNSNIVRCAASFENGNLLIYGLQGGDSTNYFSDLSATSSFVLKASDGSVSTAASGGTAGITTMYGGYSPATMGELADGRLVNIPLHSSNVIPSLASDLAALIASHLNSDPEFSASSSGADLIVNNSSPGDFPEASGGSTGWVVSTNTSGFARVTCSSDLNTSLSGDYFDIHNTTGTARVWLRYPVAVAMAKIRFGLTPAGSTFAAPVNGSTVTIGGKTYTFVTSTPTVEGQVRVPASPTADSVSLNLIRAINRSGTHGTDYYCLVTHPTVTAFSSPLGDKSYFKSVLIQSNVASIDSNSIGLSTGGASNIKFGTNSTAVLVRGANPADGSTVNLGQIYRFKNTTAAAYDVKIAGTVAETTLNLIKAINGTGTPGTDYHAGTSVNTYLSCGAAFVDDKLLLTLGSGGSLAEHLPLSASSSPASSMSFVDRSGAAIAATSGGVDGITSMYGGLSSVAPSTPSAGRLIPVTITPNPSVAETPASSIASTIADAIEADAEFTASPDSASVNIFNATSGGLIYATSGSTGWGVSENSQRIAPIKLKSLGTSELVVAVTPN